MKEKMMKIDVSFVEFYAQKQIYTFTQRTIYSSEELE